MSSGAPVTKINGLLVNKYQAYEVWFGIFLAMIHPFPWSNGDCVKYSSLSPFDRKMRNCLATSSFPQIPVLYWDQRLNWLTLRFFSSSYCCASASVCNPSLRYVCSSSILFRRFFSAANEINEANAHLSFLEQDRHILLWIKFWQKLSICPTVVCSRPFFSCRIGPDFFQQKDASRIITIFFTSRNPLSSRNFFLFARSSSFLQ